VKSVELEIPAARACVAEDEELQGCHRETPDHAESVRFARKVTLPRDDDGDDLQRTTILMMRKLVPRLVADGTRR